MSEITAASVGKLRELTGAGLMECKKALIETAGNIEAAVDLLRKKGVATAAKKATRDAKDGLIAQFIQPGSKVGVLVEVGAGKDTTVATEEFKQLVRDITLQIAAGSPHSVHRDEIHPDVLNKEKEIAAEQVKGKPPQAIAKIVEGKLEKFYQTHCLVDQGFVKRNSEVSVKEHIGSIAKQLGDEIAIRRFVRFQVGEK